MKNKKRLLIILALCFTVLLTVSLAACNPEGGNNNTGGPNKYEQAKFTVTFNTNGGTTLPNPVLRDVPYGTSIKAPADASGNKIVPKKTGYTFKWWSANGSSQFNFSTEVITANTTLTAIYDAKEYRHTPKLNDTLVYDAENKTFTIKENSRSENDVTLPKAELEQSTTTLKSKYASSGNKLPCPKATDENNKFCFWYYMSKDNKPVQFSKWSTSGAVEVEQLASYYFTNEDGLVLYPMFTDNLPKVTVKFVDSLSDTVYDKYTEDYVFGQNIAFTDESLPKPDAKVGYTFDYWYYVVENKDKEGNITYENEAFVFDMGKENTTPTSPMDAAGAEDNFTPVELKLYAKWTREITIGSAAEYKALYDEFKGLVNKDEPEDKDLARIEEIQNANIIFKGTIDFGVDGVFEPLFDKNHPFKGTIDGANYNDDHAITAKAKLKGGKFGDATTASFLGYNEGTVKNLDFENIGLGITDKTTVRAYIGVVATYNSGTVDNCVVTMTDYTINGLQTVVFGGITAVNQGGTNRNGVIRLCTVNMAGFNAKCEALTFGGIAGESTASANITWDTVIINISSIECEDDRNSQNGRSTLNLGGLVGINASVIRLCTVEKFEVESAVSLTKFVFGGIAAINSGNIRVTKANVTLGSEQAPVSVRGSLTVANCIGGMVGENEGYAINSYVTANMYVKVDETTSAGKLFIGGIMGSNYSDKTEPSTSSSETGICAINYCYSLGEIKVTVADGVKGIEVYAGGIAGRNSHKKVGSLFSTVKIAVSNDGESYLGHMFGKMLNNVGTNGKIFYDKDSVITLNKAGNTYEIKGDGKGSEEYVNFTNVGDGTVESNFRDANWVVGSPSSSSVIGFGDSWQVLDNKYPTFKDSVYND